MLNLEAKKEEIRNIRNTYKEDLQKKYINQVLDEVKTYQSNIDSEMEKERQAIDKRIESKKPSDYETPGEREERENKQKTFKSEVELENRTLDKDSVAVMGYLTQTVLSRLAAEANGKDDVLRIMGELASHPDVNMRYVLIDHFHEIQKISQQLEDVDDFAVREMRKQYKAAIESMKSEEQKVYEKELAGAEIEKSKVFTKYLPVKQNIKSFLSHPDYGGAGWGDSEKDFNW